MKKIFTLITSMAVVAMASATDYTERMLVKINDQLTPETEATITLSDEDGDGQYDFTLKNFSLYVGEDVMYVGTIMASNVPATQTSYGVLINVENAHAVCLPGDDETIAWVGPYLMPNGVDLELMAMANDEHMEAEMEMTVNGMDIEVYFGSVLVDEELTGIEKIVYDEPLAVLLYGFVVPQGNAEIELLEDDDTDLYTLTLKNFIFSMGDTTIDFGNVMVSNMDLDDDELGVITFNVESTATVTAGDMEGVTMWMGPILCPDPIPVTISGTANIFSMEVTINLTGIPTVGDIVVYYGKETVYNAGISSVIADSIGEAAIHDLRGIRVDNPTPGNIYIKRAADGKVTKFIAR